MTFNVEYNVLSQARKHGKVDALNSLSHLKNKLLTSELVKRTKNF